MKIGIILGSIRDERLGTAVADWVVAQAQHRGPTSYDLVDLRTFDVPLLTGPVPMTLNKQYPDPRVQAWSDAVDQYDGYVFVTAEYNHGIPGAFKNAIDSLGTELVGKPVGFVSYGAEGGVRAVESWRLVVANFSMIGVRQQVSVSLFTEFGDQGFQPAERRTGEIATLFDQLEDAIRRAQG